MRIVQTRNGWALQVGYQDFEGPDGYIARNPENCMPFASMGEAAAYAQSSYPREWQQANQRD
jgi:hypothetical protein